MILRARLCYAEISISLQRYFQILMTNCGFFHISFLKICFPSIGLSESATKLEMISRCRLELQLFERESVHQLCLLRIFKGDKYCHAEQLVVAIIANETCVCSFICCDKWSFSELDPSNDIF